MSAGVCKTCGFELMLREEEYCSDCCVEAHVQQRITEACAPLRAEVKDLKARLKACREYQAHPYAVQGRTNRHWTEMHDRATDLRRKNWRKP